MKKVICPKCGGNLLIEYTGNFGLVHRLRQDGTVGQKLKRYDYELDGRYMVYCRDCGEGYDGRFKDGHFILYEGGLWES